MLTLEQIKQQLQDRRLQMISDTTGIHYNTLKTIRDDANPNPTYRVIEQLSAYLEGSASTGDSESK